MTSMPTLWHMGANPEGLLGMHSAVEHVSSFYETLDLILSIAKQTCKQANKPEESNSVASGEKLILSMYTEAKVLVAMTQHHTS